MSALFHTVDCNQKFSRVGQASTIIPWLEEHATEGSFFVPANNISNVPLTWQENGVNLGREQLIRGLHGSAVLCMDARRRPKPANAAASRQPGFTACNCVPCASGYTRPTSAQTSSESRMRLARCTDRGEACESCEKALASWSWRYREITTQSLTTHGRPRAMEQTTNIPSGMKRPCLFSGESEAPYNEGGAQFTCLIGQCTRSTPA